MHSFMNLGMGTLHQHLYSFKPQNLAISFSLIANGQVPQIPDWKKRKIICANNGNFYWKYCFYKHMSGQTLYSAGCKLPGSWGAKYEGDSQADEKFHKSLVECPKDASGKCKVIKYKPGSDKKCSNHREEVF